MNYRHAYHAGNFADVVKHIALVGVLLHLRKKQTPFAVIDTHAGRGVYDLTAGEARRTREADFGIARLADVRSEDAPPFLAEYLKVARDGAHYPGSPLIAARFLRPQDRLIAIEKHPEEAAVLANVLQPFTRARVSIGDGYENLTALLPPQERRGLVLIDPPYETESDFTDAAQAVASTMNRFATGIVIVWFPIKSKAEADAFCGEALAAGVAKALRVDIAIDATARDGKERLTAAGLLVINPRFEFDLEMTRALAVVAPLLNARPTITWLVGA
jgi:23S rRNA (adenine2030-N6)-methyltransferase